MKHIILLFFIISFTSGIAAMIIGSMLYIKNKLEIIKYIIFTDGYFSGLLFLDIINYYVEINYIKTEEIFYMIVLIGLLSTGIGLIYYFTKFNHCLLNIEFTINKKYLFATLAGIALILLLGLNIAYANNTENRFFQYPSSFLIHNLFTGIGAFYNIYLFTKYRQSINKITKRFFIIGSIFIVILVPVSLVMNSLEFYVTFPIPMPFSPIIYFLVNILAILYVRRLMQYRLDTSIQKQKIILKNFLEQYDLTERESEIVEYILEGYSNQNIGDLLFISSNTVKNHIYNIYKKMDIKNRFELMSKIGKIKE